MKDDLVIKDANVILLLFKLLPQLSETFPCETDIVLCGLIKLYSTYFVSPTLFCFVNIRIGVTRLHVCLMLY